MTVADSKLFEDTADDWAQQKSLLVDLEQGKGYRRKLI